jgi:hypothetical protein
VKKAKAGKITPGNYNDREALVMLMKIQRAWKVFLKLKKMNIKESHNLQAVII